MLQSLSIRDYLLVASLDLEFGPGFTALSGETGAGKSILLDALGMALGGRTDSGAVRPGTARAEVTACFAIEAQSAAAQWLAAQDLAADGMAVLRRTVDGQGRSRAWINDRPVTANAQRDLGQRLLTVHGQHDQQRLLSAEAQRLALDRYAGALHAAQQVRAAHQAWKAAQAACLAAERALTDAARRREEIDWHLGQLRALRFTPESWQEANANHQRLAHAQELLDKAGQALGLLREETPSAIGVLDAALALVLAGEAHDPGLGEVARMLSSAKSELQEAAHDLSRYRDRLDPDPQALAALDARLSEVLTMARKYRVEPRQLPDVLAAYERELATLPGPATVSVLSAKAAELHAAFEQAVAQLSAARGAAATALAVAVAGQLPSLALPAAEFVVALTAVAPGADGAEAVEFQFRANPGVPLTALARAASGGELSRLGLALQSALGHAAQLPTLVFDEVDTGIGGAVADGVGRALARLGRSAQVLSVTHLAQVAAHADAHFKVSKDTADDAAWVTVAHLDRQSRLEELARMLSGLAVTAATRAAAEELLRLASRIPPPDGARSRARPVKRAK
jgi:DNA repair protein RecN (Recombination protein N)